jgi:hypothetical protein
MTEDLKQPTYDDAVEWFSKLSKDDQERVRQQRLIDLVNKGPAKAPELGKMSEAEFAAYKRSLGIG